MIDVLVPNRRPARRFVSTSTLGALALLVSLAVPAAAQPPTELFISEYVEGSSLNKAIEIFNGTGAAVDLAAGGYQLEFYFNGSPAAGVTIALTGVVATGDVYVVADDGASAAILAQTDQTSTANFFNGDDAVVLRKAGAVIDAIGEVGFDPGSQWGSGLVSTQDNTLRRQPAVCAGDTVETDPFDPSLEWDGFAQDTFDGLGAHSVSCAAAGAPTLLLSELVVTPTAGEFIEIHNPTAAAIDLTDVYLTDATFAPGGDFYYNIVTGADAGGGGFGDFHARFPAGASIAPGEYQTVALAGSDDFFGEYGVMPTYELFEDGVGADAVPDMVEALPGSINNQGGLTNSGEVVILYGWDGASDLVHDLDYALWGDKDEAVDKTGVAIDGPDADSATSTYLPDTAIASQDVIAPGGHAFGDSFQRLDFDEGAETPSGGNGATGHDETSEDLSNTWAELPPTPGAGVPAPAAEPLLLTEVVVTPTAGEFIEIHNSTGSAVDLSSYYLTDATFAPGGIFYYNVVTGANAGGGGFADFHARFPAGASIAPGEYQTVAIAGSDDFFGEYGVMPTYELFEDGVGADAVPDMEEALPGSINNQGGLTNSGEVVILYFWDGASDLVTDVDYALWGDKDEAVDKTGVAIDGPDADAATSAYLPDTAIPSQDVIAPSGHAFGSAFQRVDLTEGAETPSGGNGAGGADETSEDLSVTWSSDDAPTPGAPAPSGWVINEIHADPAGDGDCGGFGLPAGCGDANGDGVRDSTDDEFVEIANVTGAAQDISGWTLSDGFGVRHTFPGGTVVPDGCAIVVFGDGPLIGTFGGAVVQEASSGALGLNNGGDTVTLTTDLAVAVATAGYGGEGGDNQSLTRDPDVTGGFVKHTVAAPGVLFSPGTLNDGSAFGGCTPPPLLEIFEIQGPGLFSPFEDQLVVTDDNVVTCLATNGFFMQTPTARTDGDPDTSDGIFVFTGAAPTVAVGDLVDVVARVDEFFGLTELSSVVSVTVDGSGAVPAAILFDGVTPSPDPTAPSCATGLADPDDQLECFEGMLVEIADGTVTGPNQRFSTDTIAEVHITAASARTFREPGIEFPGLGGLPVWDGNPEVFELDPDKLGLPNQIIPAGSSFSATGVIGFEFGGYELWPNQLTVTPAPLPVAVRPRDPGEFTVGSLNLLRLFDDVDDPPDMNFMGEVRDDLVVSSAEYARRLAKFAAYVVDVLDAPDVLAVQEAEKLGVLEDLAAAISVLDPAVVYAAFLEEGNDVGTIDNGFLVRDSIAVDAVTQLGLTETYFDPVNLVDDILHDRPPLLLEGRCQLDFGEFPIAVMGVHNRSLGGIDSPVDGPRVREKRLQQANSIAQKVQALQDADPEVHLAVVGDFNAFEFTDGYVDAVGRIAGDFVDDDDLVVDPTDYVDPDLVKEVLGLPAEERYSFIFRGSAQVLDHALISQGLAPFSRGLEYGRGNADAAVDLINDDSTPLRSSDHDGLVLYVMKDEDTDGVADDVDVCPETVIPEATVPSERLGVNRWALVDGDGIFDTTPPPGRSGPAGERVSLPPVVDPFTVQQTGGCSCEQIIDALGLGQGHVKFGCSTGAMRTWIDLVNP